MTLADKPTAPADEALTIDELARRVKVEQAVDERGPAVDDGEALAEAVTDGADVLGDLGGSGKVVVVERRRALVGAAALAATDRAAKVLPSRRGGLRRRRCLVAGCRPDDLVGDEHPLACRAASGEWLADGILEARLATGRGGHRLERGVEMAQVRWPQHQLREKAGERARFEAHGASLAADRGMGDPATPAMDVEDDVAGARVALDPRGNERRRRRRCQAIEEGQ